MIFEQAVISNIFGGGRFYLTMWGGNRENFEKSDPQIIDFPLGNCISDFKIVKIFACGAGEKLVFWR